MDFSLEDMDLSGHTKIEDIETPLQVETEDLGIENLPQESLAVWCSKGTEQAIRNCGGPQGAGPPPPAFAASKGRDGVYHLHLFGGNKRIAIAPVFQLLMNLDDSETINIYFHSMSWMQTTLLQSAIKNCKATTICHIYMVEPSPVQSCAFFTWMLGDILMPIPYDVIGLSEPMTIFLAGSPKTYHNDVLVACGKSLKQNWYDYAVDNGLLTLEEVIKLNEGHDITITGINTRIEAYNKKKGYGDAQ